MDITKNVKTERARLSRSDHILSFDPQDVSDPGLTGGWAQRLGVEYAAIQDAPDLSPDVCSVPTTKKIAF